MAQPGGRLWRVGLFDGEVESMHRPTIDVDQESEENGSGAACDLELGALRAADLGDARVSERLTSLFFYEYCTRPLADPFTVDKNNKNTAVKDGCEALFAVVL